MDERDKQIKDNLKAKTPTLPLARRSEQSRNLEPLAEMLRSIACDMDDGDWSEPEAAVLIVRDKDGYLTFCEWGESGQLVEQAHQTKRAEA